MTFALAEGNSTFEGTDSNVLTLAGLRVTAQLQYIGSPMFPNATINIYGMSQSDMNALASITEYPLSYKRNTVILEADSGNGFVCVFVGQISWARADYTSQPDVFFSVTAMSLGFQKLSTAPVNSYTGSTDVATIVAGLARQMGAAFLNDGVTGYTLDSPYLPGTLADQLKSVCQMAGIEYYIEPAPTTAAGNVTNAAVLVVIAPYGQLRSTAPWDLSPDNGLIGYPMRDSQGFVECSAIFNPAFRLGGKVNIAGSGVQILQGNALATVAANNVDGPWKISVMNAVLEANKFGGIWRSDLKLSPPGRAFSIVASPP